MLLLALGVRCGWIRPPSPTLSTVPSPTAWELPIASHPVRIGIDPTAQRAVVLSRGPLGPAERPRAQGTVTLLDLDARRVISTARVGLDPTALAFDPIADLLFIANRGIPEEGVPGTVTILEASSGKVLRDVPLGIEPTALGWAGHGMVLVAVREALSAPGRVILLDGRTGVRQAEIPVGVYPSDIAVDPSGDRTWVANFLSNTVDEIDLVQRRVQRTLRLGPEPGTLARLALDPGMGMLFAMAYPPRMTGGGTVEGMLWGIDTERGAVQAAWPIANPTAMAVDPIAHRVLVGGATAEGGWLGAFDPREERPVWRIPVGTMPWAIGIDGEAGRILVLDREQGMVWVLNREGKIECARPAGRQPVALAVDPCSHGVLVGDVDRVRFLNPICGTSDSHGEADTESSAGR